MVFSPENDPSPLPPLDAERIRYLGDAQRLCLKPGDVVVLTLRQIVSVEVANRIKDAIQSTIPGHKVLLLEPDMKIGVIGKD